MVSLYSLEKKILFTIVLDYKKNNYIYQLWAVNEIEANLNWAKTINLFEIGVRDIKMVKNKLIADAMDEDFYPLPLEKSRLVWDVSCECLGDEENFAVANIIATISSKTSVSDINKSKNHNTEQILFNSSKHNILYTIQLGYKGGIYVDQVFANDPVEAKIKWIKQLDFHGISGAPNKNIEEVKNNILLQQKEPNFAPQELQDFDSVWSTSVLLGDEIGRITIVATKLDNFKV